MKLQETVHSYTRPGYRTVYGGDLGSIPPDSASTDVPKDVIASAYAADKECDEGLPAGADDPEVDVVALVHVVAEAHVTVGGLDGGLTTAFDALVVVVDGRGAPVANVVPDVPAAPAAPGVNTVRRIQPFCKARKLLGHIPSPCSRCAVVLDGAGRSPKRLAGHRTPTGPAVLGDATLLSRGAPRSPVGRGRRRGGGAGRG
ncbi:hypothetical protein ACIQD1_18680 [Streptomyces sp. NPDC093088]|uniref:hypothetical protein n=1 Tax=Streptomyces sp. NPDC093088 TaxID=3366023 RepID=UPI003824D679